MFEDKKIKKYVNAMLPSNSYLLKVASVDLSWKVVGDTTDEDMPCAIMPFIKITFKD